MAATAVEAWDERWATPEGRNDWLVPHPAVAALVPVLKARIRLPIRSIPALSATACCRSHRRIAFLAESGA
jgi:hypothetical protein